MDVLRAWVDCLDEVISKGRRFVDNEGRACLELLHHTFTSDAKNVSKPLDEMRRFDAWSFPSREELSRILEQRDRSLSFSLGSRMFQYRNVLDQLNEFVIPLLKRDINSRRALVVLYDPEQDSKLDERMTPGLVLVYFKAHGRKIDVSCFVRSNDVLLGFPITVVQLSSIQEIVCNALKLEPGSIVVHSGSLHVYEDNASVASEVIGRCRKNS